MNEYQEQPGLSSMKPNQFVNQSNGNTIDLGSRHEPRRYQSPEAIKFLVPPILSCPSFPLLLYDAFPQKNSRVPEILFTT
jgi:hypothetical protein